MRWPLVALGDVATIERCGIEAADIPDGTRYVGLENISAGQEITSWQIVGEVQVASTKFRFGPGHVLYGKLRPNLGKIARPNFSGVCSTDILPIRPGPNLDRNYLRHFLAQPSMIDFAASRAAGANLPRLSPRVLARFEVPLPALEEQRRIAAILDQADALSAQRRQSVDRLDELVRSIFLSMFCDFAGPFRTVEEIADPQKGAIRTGPFGSQLLHSEFVDAGVAVLGIDNVVTNEFQWAGRRFITAEKYATLKRYTVEPGDVLITIMGTCGRCAIVPADVPTAINTKHICAITVDRSEVLPEFLRACFLWHPKSRRYLLRSAKGAIMDGLNMGIVKAMPMPVPPMEAQWEFVTRSATVGQHRDVSTASQDQIEELVDSLQARAFSGGL